MDCVFCSIVQKKIPAEIVFEDADTLAFLTIEPVNQGHCLVIPKQHVEDFFAISDSLLATLFMSGKRIGKAIMNATGADGLNVEMNNKPAAGQSVLHAHLHLIPRFLNDGFRHWPHKEVTSKELNQMRENIAVALQ